MGFRLTAAARADVKAVLLRSRSRFGDHAAARYAWLVQATFAALGDNALPPGSSSVSRAGAARSYPLRARRQDVPADQRVNNPSYIVLYRVTGDGDVQILGFVHERMLLPRAARRALRAADKDDL